MANGNVLAGQKIKASGQLSSLETLAMAYGIVARHVPPFGTIATLLALVNEGTIYLARRLIEEETPELLAAMIESGGGLVGLALTTVLGAVVGVA